MARASEKGVSAPRLKRAMCRPCRVISLQAFSERGTHACVAWPRGVCKVNQLSAPMHATLSSGIAGI